MSEDRTMPPRRATKTYYDVVMRRLESETERIDALDRKAALTLTAAALLPLFGVILTAGSTPLVSIGLYFIAFVVYVVMVGYAIASTRVRHWSGRPDLPTLAQHAREHDEATVKWWVATECTKSIEANRPKLTTKALYVDYAFALLATAAFLLALAAFIDLAA